MSLAAAVTHYLPVLLDLARRDGIAKQDEIVATGLLPDEPDYGHLRMKLFRWDELEQSLERHGRIVASAAAGVPRTPSSSSPSCARSSTAPTSPSPTTPAPSRAACTWSRSWRSHEQQDTRHLSDGRA